LAKNKFELKRYKIQVVDYQFFAIFIEKITKKAWIIVVDTIIFTSVFLGLYF
jgi:hypothetical protein